MTLQPSTRKALTWHLEFAQVLYHRIHGVPAFPGALAHFLPAYSSSPPLRRKVWPGPSSLTLAVEELKVLHSVPDSSLQFLPSISGSPTRERPDGLEGLSIAGPAPRVHVLEFVERELSSEMRSLRTRLREALLWRRAVRGSGQAPPRQQTSCLLGFVLSSWEHGTPAPSLQAFTFPEVGAAAHS